MSDEAESKWTKPVLYASDERAAATRELKKKLSHVEAGAAWETDGMDWRYVDGFAEGLRCALEILHPEFDTDNGQDDEELACLQEKINAMHSGWEAARQGALPCCDFTGNYSEATDHINTTTKGNR